MSLLRTLASVASVYDDLLDASLPGRGDPEERPAPDPTRKPAPGELGVLDHRHLLVRGLRWWVDAVRDSPDTRVGHDVTAMCRWLAVHVDVMAAEDRAALDDQLGTWLAKAARMMGAPERPPVDLVQHARAPMPQGAAARLLGVPASTVWRRAGKRGGYVRLADVAGPRCEPCDLPVAWCPHAQ